MDNVGVDFDINIAMADFCSPSGMLSALRKFCLFIFAILSLNSFLRFLIITGQMSHGSMSQHTNSTQSSPLSQQNYYQYLTPPSQHSGGITPQHLAHTLDSYPTPSPESPGHWSSSSPHSTSDWSEGISSPPANNLNYIASSVGHQSNKGTDAIYI